MQTLKNPAHFIADYSGPCVIMATPSGLQSGASRDFFEAWCEDARNTCIICDFAVQVRLRSSSSPPRPRATVSWEQDDVIPGGGTFNVCCKNVCGHTPRLAAGTGEFVDECSASCAKR